MINFVFKCIHILFVKNILLNYNFIIEIIKYNTNTALASSHINFYVDKFKQCK